MFGNHVSIQLLEFKIGPNSKDGLCWEHCLDSLSIFFHWSKQICSFKRLGQRLVVHGRMFDVDLFDKKTNQLDTERIDVMLI